MSDDKAALRPCPNTKCGSTNVTETSVNLFWVQCDDCEMEGPSADSQEEARRLWNALPREPRMVETPTESGWYWIREPHTDQMEVAFIDVGDNCVDGYHCACYSLSNLAKEGYRFYGPLEPPVVESK